MTSGWATARLTQTKSNQQAMTIIADSGSTKTDWCFVGCDNHPAADLRTQGCNPYFVDSEELSNIFREVSTQLADKTVDSIYFYGAGCTPGEKTEMIAQTLQSVFGEQCEVCVASDMVGAARALCQNTEGIACILGTGSNSCLYNGREIVANVPPLGFILGDEGSGAHLGKLFTGNALKNQLDSETKAEFLAEYGSEASIIDRVYRQPLPNRWLASLSPFIASRLGNARIRKMAGDAFRAFFERNILNYNRPELKIGMTGSVAYYYQDVIKEVAADMQLKIGAVAKSPMEGLIQYHAHEDWASSRTNAITDVYRE